jgi:PAS domain S-box-containing protein
VNGRRIRPTTEDVVLLAVAATAAAAVYAVLDARPAGAELWLTSASALAFGLAALLFLWLRGVARRARAERMDGDDDPARNLLAALPEGLVLVRGQRIASVNRALCELLGFERAELVGRTMPFPFWPPERWHEIEQWHADLERHGELAGELTFCDRSGERRRVAIAGRVVRDPKRAAWELVTVRDVSDSHRRERRLAEVSTRDPETGLLHRDEFEDRLGQATRRATQSGVPLAIVLARLDLDGGASLSRPEALIAVDRLRRTLRAGDELARTGLCELAWILPDTDAAGADEAVARWRAEIADVGSVGLTAGVCDLAAADGNPVALYALADRALAAARVRGAGATERYAATPPRPTTTKLV